MTYVKISFSETTGSVDYLHVASLNGFRKDRIYRGSSVFMYVDSSKIEKGRMKFKKLLLGYYKQLIDQVNVQLAF